MEKSLILNLSYGAGYRDGINIFGIKEYNELNNKFKNMCFEICKDMPEDKKSEILIEFQDLQTGMEVICGDEHFKLGFKLGLTIAAQSFLD